MFLNVLGLILAFLVLSIHHLKYRARVKAELEDLKTEREINKEKQNQPNANLSIFTEQNKETGRRMDKLVQAVESLNKQLDKLRDEKNEAIMAYAKIERDMALVQQQNKEHEKNLSEWKQIQEDGLKNTKIIIAQFVGKIYKHLVASGKLNTSDLSHILQKEGVDSKDHPKQPSSRMVFKGGKNEVASSVRAEASKEAMMDTRDKSDLEVIKELKESKKGIALSDEEMSYDVSVSTQVAKEEGGDIKHGVEAYNTRKTTASVTEEWDSRDSELNSEGRKESESKKIEEEIKNVDWDGNSLEEKAKMNNSSTIGYEHDEIHSQENEMEKFLSQEETIATIEEDKKTQAEEERIEEKTEIPVTEVKLQQEPVMEEIKQKEVQNSVESIEPVAIEMEDVNPISNVMEPEEKLPHEVRAETEIPVIKSKEKEEVIAEGSPVGESIAQEVIIEEPVKEDTIIEERVTDLENPRQEAENNNEEIFNDESGLNSDYHPSSEEQREEYLKTLDQIGKKIASIEETDSSNSSSDISDEELSGILDNKENNTQ